MKKIIALMFTVSALALAGCCTTPHSAKWEYKTIVTPNDSVTLTPASNGWILNDAVLNSMLVDGWRVANYGVDQSNSQWFLLKRHKK
jgi:hypothetical protein